MFVTKGLFLFSVDTQGADGMLLVSKHRDIAEVSKIAQRLTKSKKSEFYGARVKSVEYRGTIDN